MKKYWLAVLLGVSVLAAGCKGTTDKTDTAREAEAENKETEDQEKEALKSDGMKDAILAGTGTLSDAAKSAYRSVLDDIYYNQQFPNGLELDYNGSDLSENKFGVYDIDGDGRDELLIAYTTASTDSQMFLIYDFVEALDAVHEEFTGYPAATFYDNGVVRADWSHDPSTAEGSDFQPFTLLVYDEGENTYEFLGSVCQQDNPDVYYQKLAGDENEAEIDETVLKDWLDFCIGDAGQIEVPMVDLTEENIKALK